ncbi:MAG: glutathione S-transferase family protein [Burkholderiaceae bacterium]
MSSSPRTRARTSRTPAFKLINPNAKTPAMVDGDVAVFDSNAILMELAEKTGKFLRANTPALRAAMHSWLIFVATVIGPDCGQATDLKLFEPEPHSKAYSGKRYTFEAGRYWDGLHRQPGSTCRGADAGVGGAECRLAREKPSKTRKSHFWSSN